MIMDLDDSRLCWTSGAHPQLDWNLLLPWSGQSKIQIFFNGIIVIQSLQLFHCLYHFCIDSGLRGCFYFFVDILVKKVSSSLLSDSESLTMFIAIILINHRNCFQFFIIILPIIICRNYKQFFNLQSPYDFCKKVTSSVKINFLVLEL